MGGVKNHAGAVETLTSEVNTRGQLEVRTFDDRNQPLWSFVESPHPREIQEGSFFSPVYRTKIGGQEIRRTSNLFYIHEAQNESGETGFVEMGAGGYLNPTHHSACRLNRDVANKTLVPLSLVRSGELPVYDCTERFPHPLY